ncbi:MAG: ammonia-forming cytochrome c nitrite reductase subunit c552 [Myxococcota bacterium]|nr:ammonia-forming cytochrome c nitrite reductase subunit c552 [Deltaproteobacteria bacterium]MDQ3336335.1 ammonia-forming cytochrome c nitrite reductase subunit c552 [Myxococcota bacterium]
MKTKYVIVGATVAGALAATAVAALLVNISNRKHEATNPYFRVVALDEQTIDASVWGKNFPGQYDGYRRTVDQVRTRYGGSEAVQRTPSAADPRSIVAQSRLEEDPRLVTIWEGYAFSKDFREERGHAYMLSDQELTQRQVVAKQPGACLHCHASIYNAYKQAGGGDLTAGFEKVNQMPYADARQLVAHPISCIDCHDPKTMELRITRPGFIEGIRALKAKEGIAGYDVNRDASHQEMRSFICGQCHVEYYFKGPEKRLTYPWLGGLNIDAIYAYYTEVGHSDWTHPRAGTKLLKAQHPEFEMYNQGVHARSGVACADCHMPYMRVGAAKISDHHVRSPLLNINRACQPCHKFGEDELRARVHVDQDRTYALRNRAMDAVVALIEELAAAKTAGKTDDELAPARELHRQAQFYLDFIEAENSMGFHAPGEAARILATSIDLARQGQLALRPGASAALTR